MTIDGFFQRSSFGRTLLLLADGIRIMGVSILLLVWAALLLAVALIFSLLTIPIRKVRLF